MLPNLYTIPILPGPYDPVHAWGAIGYGYKSPLIFIRETGKSRAFKQTDYLAQVLQAHL
jgi:hypothetical protein